MVMSETPSSRTRSATRTAAVRPDPVEDVGLPLAGQHTSAPGVGAGLASAHTLWAASGPLSRNMTPAQSQRNPHVRHTNIGQVLDIGRRGNNPWTCLLLLAGSVT